MRLNAYNMLWSNIYYWKICTSDSFVEFQQWHLHPGMCLQPVIGSVSIIGSESIIFDVVKFIVLDGDIVEFNLFISFAITENEPHRHNIIKHKYET